MSEGRIEEAEIRSQDSRDIADMKEKVSMDKKVLEADLKEGK